MSNNLMAMNTRMLLLRRRKMQRFYRMILFVCIPLDRKIKLVEMMKKITLHFKSSWIMKIFHFVHMLPLFNQFLKIPDMAHLAGLVDRACDSWSHGGHEFKLHSGPIASLKFKKTHEIIIVHVLFARLLLF